MITFTNATTVIPANLLNILPDDCMEKIQLHFLNMSCDDIEIKLEDIIDILMNVVQQHFMTNKQIKNHFKIFERDGLLVKLRQLRHEIYLLTLNETDAQHKTT